MSLVGQVQAFAVLTERKRVLKERLQRVNEDLRILESEICAHLAERGERAVDFQDGSKVWLKRRIWARPVDRDRGRAAEALRHVNLGHLVEETVNTHTLSAHFNQIAKEHPDWPLERLIPEELHSSIALTEDYTIGVKSGN